MVKFKELSTKEKVEYIWDYYKLPIFAVIFFIFAAAYIIVQQTTRIEYIFNLTLVGSSIDEGKSSELGKNITKLLVNSSDKRKQAYVDFMPTTKKADGSEELDPQMVQKFMVKIAAGDVDLLVINKSDLSKFIAGSMFVKLDNIKDINLSQIKGDKYGEGGIPSSNNVYAVDADGNKYLKAIGFDTQNKVIGIPANGKRQDSAVKVLKWLLSN